jgi:hypothetical protein
MPVQINWVDAEEKTIRIDVEGSWPLEEYLKGIHDAISMTKEKPYTVHTIVDMTNSSNFPTQVISAAKGYDTRFPANQGLFVMVNTPLYLRTMVQIAVKMYSKTASNVFFADSFDAALHLIEEHEADTSINAGQ